MYAQDNCAYIINLRSGLQAEYHYTEIADKQSDGAGNDRDHEDVLVAFHVLYAEHTDNEVYRVAVRDLAVVGGSDGHEAVENVKIYTGVDKILAKVGAGEAQAGRGRASSCGEHADGENTLEIGGNVEAHDPVQNGLEAGGSGDNSAEAEQQGERTAGIPRLIIDFLKISEGSYIAVLESVPVQRSADDGSGDHGADGDHAGAEALLAEYNDENDHEEYGDESLDGAGAVFLGKVAVLGHDIAALNCISPAVACQARFFCNMREVQVAENDADASGHKAENGCGKKRGVEELSGGECFPYILSVCYCDDENADYGEQGYLFASECADHKYCQRENNAEDLKCYWCFHSVVPFSMIVMIFSVFCRMSLGSVTGKSL